MSESAKEVCGSVIVGGKNPKSVWYNDELKAAVRRKEVLTASDEKRKDKKIRTSNREEKMVGFSPASLFLAGKRETVTQGGNPLNRPPDAVDNPGS